MPYIRYLLIECSPTGSDLRLTKAHPFATQRTSLFDRT